MTQVASFTIGCTGFLDMQGRATKPLPDFAKDAEALIGLYRAMVLTRTFDAKAVSLQRTGRLGTFASSLGQEAVSVGVAAAMRPEDVFLPSFREHGAQILRGVTMTELLLYWGGDERGSDFAAAREDFPVCIPVGTHAPHAAGAALAFKLRKEPRVAVCIFGDGATSRGDVYEAMNFAGLRQLPVVFVVNNNQWAISMPRQRQTAAETLAQKAVAAGIAGEQVDGNDVIAVRHVVEAAIARARDGGGPGLVEAITYRLSDHTTADDASRYREDTQVSPHWKEEPVARLRRYLVDNDHWSKADEEELIADCTARVERSIAEYLATPALPPAAMFDHLFAELPAALAAQRTELAEAPAATEEEPS